MKIRNYYVLAGVLLAGALYASEPEQEPAKVVSSFYKGPALFSTRANENKEKQPIEHFGPVGIGIDLLLPPFQMQLSRIDKGSPAAAAGKLKVGQRIESINGQTLKDIDPRIQLGAIITQAEATDGVIKFMVKDTPDAKAEEVIVNIPVLGEYSKTWPLNCPKSDKIVRNQADFLARSGNYAGPGINGLGLLYMLSTGEEQDLEVARRWVRERVPKTPNNDPIKVYPWYLGYGGPGLCEYYLRTGDETVIPVIEKIADCLKRTMSKGGWNQKGGLSFGYGHMNAAGIHCATFLLLARECGAKVDEYTLQESLKQYYRFAGHGNVAYGDSMPEDGFVDNGKTGGLAFTMAAAAALTPEGENSVYARARDISAVKSFYSTSWMLHGHTGGGIGEIWRSTAMGLMAEKAPLKYREFMDNRQWFYELSRHHDGSMGIVSANFGMGGRYDSPTSWGIGVAMTYTIPRKTLRITGAPPTKFSKPYQLPKRPWGTAADEAFYSLTSSADKDGKIPDWSAEKLATDASWPIGGRIRSATDAVLLQYARHPDQGVRQMAAQTIGGKESDRLIIELLKDKDPRVRQAGCMAIGTRTAPPAKYEPPRAERLTDEMVQLLLGMVNDPDESWWVVQSALYCLGNARTELLVPHVDRLVYWLEHEEWWLQNGALAAVQGLVTDKQCYQKLLPRLGKLLATNQNKNLMGMLNGVVSKVREADPEVQALALQVLAQAYADIPQKLAAPGGLELNSVLGNMIGNMASTLASHPGGVEKLLDLSRQRYPDETLPHKDLFLKADITKLGPDVKEMVNSVVRDQFIPEYVANNIGPLMAETQTEPVVVNYQNQAKVEGLVDLYKKMGVNDYEWHDFGTARNEMKWDYFNFDPPETMPYRPGQTRYRKVTYPAGMENWFAVDFDARKAGWQTGLQPFGQDDGKMRTGIKRFIDQDADRNPRRRGPCGRSFCRCCEPLNTFWEKEVLLIRGTFTVPKFKDGHRYRLVVGGLSHMNTGDGVRVYVNGKQVLERTAPFPKRDGGGPVVVNINKDNLAEFQSGPVTIAATGFLKVQLRSKLKTSFMAIWFQEMQMPPLDQDMITKAAMAKPMLSADWQALQGLDDTKAAPKAEDEPVEDGVEPKAEDDRQVGGGEPEEEEADPDAGKFRWDGKFVAKPGLPGTWTTVAMVPTVDAFDPAKPVDSRNAPLKAITLKDGGLTDSATMLWSGNTLLNIARGEALKMTLKDGYLFIEAGGFATKNGPTWKPQVIVLKRE